MKSKKSNIFPEITSLIHSNEEIVVWGAGSYTNQLIRIHIWANAIL